MPANYLHGVETIRIGTGPRPVRQVKSAVTGLICLAPTGPVNEPVLIAGDADAAQFGPDLWNAGFTAAAALAANFKQGRPAAGLVIAVNVLDPAVHTTTATNEDKAFGANDAFLLDHPAVTALTLKNTAGTVTYVRDTDYTLEPLTGKVARKAGGAIAAGASVRATSYTYLDPSKVTSADVIGTTSAGGIRSGLQCFLDCFQRFGFYPKRLVAPHFSTLASVTGAMLTLANRIRARAYIDAPAGITPAAAIAGRGAGGSINFNVSSKRAILCYPHVRVVDTSAEVWDNGNTQWDGTATTRLEPLSMHAAALGNAVDIEKGYWWSGSNNELFGLQGLERTITAMVNDPDSEANLLNEAGIVTVFNMFGSGLRLWGNRSAAWPTDTSPENFECVTAVGDLIDESIEYFSLQFVDQPVNDAWIDSVSESVNGYLRKLVGDGAILDGRCWYDPNDNPATELAQGHVVFRRDFLPPIPAERITYKVRINIDYLRSLGRQET